MTKQICSIYFSQLSEQRRPSYQGIFNIPVVKKGDKPVLLSIRDHYENNDLPFFAGTSANGKAIKQRIVIAGELIAGDILEHWTLKHPEMHSQCGPGMWVVRDTIALWDDDGKPKIDAEGKQEFRMATEAEKAEMFAEDLAAAQVRQDAWVEVALVKGDIMAENPKAVQWIPQYCRDAVDYSGQERVWRKGLKSGDIRNCPFCTKPIAARATKCPFCSEVVDAVGHAALQARQEQALTEVAERLKRERSTKAVFAPPVANPQQAAR